MDQEEWNQTTDVLSETVHVLSSAPCFLSLLQKWLFSQVLWQLTLLCTSLYVHSFIFSEEVGGN